MIDETSSLQEVCFVVSTALAQCGVSAVLTGGSAAAVYAPTAYSSLDADFVLDDMGPLDCVIEPLASIGFRMDRRSRIFVHDRSHYTLEFPRGPLAVGADLVTATNCIENDGRRLRILTVTDCVRDRLSHFYFWNDYTALSAAVAVAKANGDHIDFALIRAWTLAESPDLQSKYDEFRSRVASEKPV